MSELLDQTSEFKMAITNPFLISKLTDPDRDVFWFAKGQQVRHWGKDRFVPDMRSAEGRPVSWTNYLYTPSEDAEDDAAWS